MSRPISNTTGYYIVKGERGKRNAENHRKWMKKRRDTDKQKLVEEFGDKCSDCGTTFPNCCYDFHHLDPATKEFEIAPSIGSKYEKVLTEAKKCVMLCSNCHRIRHYSMEI